MPPDAAGGAPAPLQMSQQTALQHQAQQLQQQQQQLQHMISAQQRQSGMSSMPRAPAPAPAPANSQLNNLPIRAYLDQTVVPILLDGTCIYLVERTVGTVSLSLTPFLLLTCT